MRKKVGPELDFALLQILEHDSSERFPLKTSQLQKRCKEVYGISVSKDVIRSRLDMLVDWASGFEAQERSPLLRSLRVTIGKKRVSQSSGYYMESRTQEPATAGSATTAESFEYCLISLDDGDIKEIAPQSGHELVQLIEQPEHDDLPPADDAHGLGMPSLFDTMVILQTAIDNHLPIDAKLERWHIQDAARYNGKEGPRTAALPDNSYFRRSDQIILSRWPFGMRRIDGVHYVVFGVQNLVIEEPCESYADMPLDDDLRIVRVDHLRDVRFCCRPEDLENGDLPIPNEEEWPSEKAIDRFFVGSFYGMGRSRGPEEVALRAKGEGLEFALEEFHGFEGFAVAKEHEDAALDRRDAQERESMGRSNARHKDGDWYTLRFIAHPRSVARWAAGFIDSVEVVEPAWARKIVTDAIRNNVYGIR